MAELIITDGSDHKINIRNKSDLTFLREFGTQGSGVGQLFYPFNSCCDGTFIYVTQNAKLSKFDLVGNYITSRYFTFNGVLSEASGRDAFRGASGVETDGTYVYVLETTNYRISKFLCSDLSYVAMLGTMAMDDPPFVMAMFPHNGLIYILDGNRQPDLFGFDPANYNIIDAGTTATMPIPCYGMCSDGTYVYSLEESRISLPANPVRIRKFNATTWDVVAELDISAFSDVSWNANMVSDGSYIYSLEWVYGLTNPNTESVVKRDLTTLAVVDYYNPPDVPGVDVYRCKGLAVDTNYVYIADTYGSKLVRITKSPMAYDQDIVALYYPMDVAVDDNYIYLVHDLYPLVVSKYDKASPFTLQATNNTSGLNSGFGRLILDGNYVWVSSANDLMMVKLNKSDLSLVSSSPSANDMGFNGYFDNNSFYRGYHMAFNPAKTELYVADSCNYDYATTRVKVHNPTTLAFIRDYAPVGFPAIIGGVCVDDTHFYVASQDPNYVLDCKIQKYTIDTFTLVATSVFNLDGPNPPGISWLEGLAVDDTYLYCADGYSNRVYRYDKSNLTLVDYVGAADRGTSVFNYPSGVAMPLESPVPPAAITNSIAQVIW